MPLRYAEFDGSPFRFQGDLGLPDNFVDFILAYGDEALRAMQREQGDPEISEMLRQMLEQGLLEKVRGRFRLTPRAVNAIQRKALMEVFAQLRKGALDGHVSPERGAGGERIEGTVPYQFGDPVSEIDVAETLRATMRRNAERALKDDERGGAGGASGLLPLRLSSDDLRRFECEARASCSTVVLLDRSGSMARFGRFLHAKKTAMALIALIRQRFPLDTVDLVGFASAAEVIAEEQLPLLMPRPVTMYDPVIRLRVPISKLEQAPPHFTNLHMGLMKARRLLARRSSENKMVFIITDGQPTAHVQGDYVHLIYPPDEQSHMATLKEAFTLSRTGVRICTFALTDDYWDMDWLGFVDHLGRLTRGIVFHTASGELSSCVMQSYIRGRVKKTFIA